MTEGVGLLLTTHYRGAWGQACRDEAGRGQDRGGERGQSTTARASE